MNRKVVPYKNEPKLFLIALVISVAAWLCGIFFSKGTIIPILLSFLVFYLFIQSAFIAYIRGTAIKVSETQFSDIHERVIYCAARIGMKQLPEVYVLHGNGIFNAFATRFLRRKYILLYSDVLDALEDRPGTINFYIGHELGHLDRRHLEWMWVLAPGKILPLLGAAHDRAQEYTCDIYGRYCCDNDEDAQYAMVALAAGHKRWKKTSIQQYAAQAKDSNGFWMSFHELVSGYPWLTKRVQRLIEPNVQVTRHPLAYVLAIFVPRTNIAVFLILYIAFIISITDDLKDVKNLVKDETQGTTSQITPERMIPEAPPAPYSENQ